MILTDGDGVVYERENIGVVIPGSALVARPEHALTERERNLFGRFHRVAEQDKNVAFGEWVERVRVAIGDPVVFGILTGVVYSDSMPHRRKLFGQGNQTILGSADAATREVGGRKNKGWRTGLQEKVEFHVVR